VPLWFQVQDQLRSSALLERFQEELHNFSGSKARQNKDLEHFVVSFET